MLDQMERVRLGVAHGPQIKLLSRESAVVYLDRYLPELTDEEDREFFLQQAGKRIPPHQPPRPQDPLFCAAMFLVGVSLGDLAMMYGVRKQTIQAKVANRLNPTERATLRDRLDALDLETLALAREMFYQAQQVQAGVWEGVHPLEIGRAVLHAAQERIARDRGDEPEPSRPRRYANTNISQRSGKEQAAEILAGVGQDTPTPAPPTDPPLQVPSQPAQVVRADEQAFLDTL